MGPEQASQLQAQYARRAGAIGLTAEELDFEHFPAKNGFPGIPVKAWIRFPNCAELVCRSGSTRIRRCGPSRCAGTRCLTQWLLDDISEGD